MKFSRETIYLDEGKIFVVGLPGLPEQVRQGIFAILAHFGLRPTFLDGDSSVLCVPQRMVHEKGTDDLAPLFARLLANTNTNSSLRKNATAVRRSYPVRIDFHQAEARATAFAHDLIERREIVIEILLDYESYEVAADEITRTIDLLTSLYENAEYFQRKIGSVATFLPKNQPLYALSCFAIVPSLMSSDVYVRPPVAMQQLFLRLTGAIRLADAFPNIHVSSLDREAFVDEHASLIYDPAAGGERPATDAVIFTGTMQNADRTRKRFDNRTLFIANGAGHNPIIVTDTADIDKAVDSVLRVQLYNSGQDCANASAILVHEGCHMEFLARLRAAVARIKVGDYRNRENRVGPLTERKELRRLQELFIANSQWLDDSTHGVIRTGPGIVEPTIICKPLKYGGNYTEHFAPVFFVQRYHSDGALAAYFDDPRYPHQAMYITVFGQSDYVDGLVGRPFEGGQVLHDETTIIRDTDLHAPGVERGTQPYGGFGRGASCVGLGGTVISMPTCPQRDIFNFLVQPSVQAESEVVASG